MIDQAAIHEGMSRDEFFLEYLPTISLRDGKCVGAEALIRWRRPDGIVSPGEFIPIAENTPLSGLLTYWVLDTSPLNWVTGSGPTRTSGLLLTSRPKSWAAVGWGTLRTNPGWPNRPLRSSSRLLSAG
jgi:hypothetical protein